MTAVVADEVAHANAVPGELAKSSSPSPVVAVVAVAAEDDPTSAGVSGVTAVVADVVVGVETVQEMKQVASPAVACPVVAAVVVETVQEMTLVGWSLGVTEATLP